MFFLLPRTVVVLTLVFALLLARRLYRQWRRRIAEDRGPDHRLPAAVLGPNDRTWVVFTTPYCASCGPVQERLRRSDPSSAVVAVDATEQVGLARAFRVRAAPTVLLADRAGKVQARLVGADAVARYLG